MEKDAEEFLECWGLTLCDNNFLIKGFEARCDFILLLLVLENDLELFHWQLCQF